MRFLDRILQRWRARRARSWVPRGGRVLDIGCHQGEFLNSLGDRIQASIGLDPLTSAAGSNRHWLLPMAFSEPLTFPDGTFDAIVLLATLEHIRDKEPLARECFRLLRAGGRIIITVPSPRVDQIVGLLHRLHLADGMSLEEHHGFDPSTTPEIFLEQGFILEHHARFQLGLNHLYVFRRDVPVSPSQREPRALTLAVGSGADE
jgi:SAM-dependent methyltransferase